MKSRFVAFIVRIRLGNSDLDLPGSPGVHGVLQQAGSSQVQPFDTFERLVGLLHTAILEKEPENLDPASAGGEQD